MNEGENSSMPNNTNFSSPNISSSDNQTHVDAATPTQQDVTSSDISAMAGTDAGAVAAAAAAMPESDGRQAISSTPSASTPSASRTRLGFSNRRFNQATAQQSAPSFAGAPDYFNQAVSDLPVDNPSQGNKKKLIALVGLVAAIAVAVVVAIIVIPMLNKPYPDGMKPDDVRSKLTQDSIEEVSKLERSIHNFATTPMLIKSFGPNKDENLIGELKKELKQYENIYEVIKDEEAIQYRADTVSYFSNAKERMAKMLPIYKTIIDRYSKFYAVIYDKASTSTISGFPGYNTAIGDDLLKFSELVAVNRAYKNSNCTEAQKKDESTACYKNKQKIIQLQAVTKSTVDMRGLIAGEYLSDIQDSANLVDRYLLSINLAVDNKKVSNDE